uniref:Uncharacterized protein n=1 Tax=Siphoviridae sp. ctwQT14 TaxID=2827971 RepID=A0A8S5TKM7_9CAUD|nr:MAG TPA: hypothetical protein [Siphoviridae sp. ctwQT14]
MSIILITLYILMIRMTARYVITLMMFYMI